MQIAIVLYPGLTALDAVGPYEILRGIDGSEIRFVWKEVGPVVTDSGVLILGATHTFDETPRPDLVLVPGSSIRTATAMADASLIEWLRQVDRTTRFTTSVCSGSAVLASAGLLAGRRATSHWAAMPLLAGFGAIPCPRERVVRDGKMWTAAGVSAGLDLALMLVAEISSETRARVIQLVIEYDPQPPFDSGHIDKASAEIRSTAQLGMARLATRPSELIALPRSLVRHWVRVIGERVRTRSIPGAQAR
jgi:transcriptional regulator GlxA family with amidase domain